MHLRSAKLFFLFFPLILFSSCTVSRTIQKMHATEVDLIHFRSDDKQVYFIPMIHVAKPEFYANVEKTVDSFKKLGYVVFHEGVKKSGAIPDSIKQINYNWLAEKGYLSRYNKSENRDSIVNDLYLRKYRKMLGFYSDSMRYASMIQQTGFFKGMVDQPRFNELTTDERDIRVDVTRYELIEAYERKFGFIELSSYDLSLTLNSSGYWRKEKLPVENVKAIIIGGRDELLAKAIEASPHKKILVVYGAAHVEGTFEKLNKMNLSWTKTH